MLINYGFFALFFCLKLVGTELSTEKDFPYTTAHNAEQLLGLQLGLSYLHDQVVLDLSIDEDSPLRQFEFAHDGAGYFFAKASHELIQEMTQNDIGTHILKSAPIVFAEHQAPEYGKIVLFLTKRIRHRAQAGLKLNLDGSYTSQGYKVDRHGGFHKLSQPTQYWEKSQHFSKVGQAVKIEGSCRGNNQFLTVTIDNVPIRYVYDYERYNQAQGIITNNFPCEKISEKQLQDHCTLTQRSTLLARHLQERVDIINSRLATLKESIKQQADEIGFTRSPAENLHTIQAAHPLLADYLTILNDSTKIPDSALATISDIRRSDWASLPGFQLFASAIEFYINILNTTHNLDIYRNFYQEKTALLNSKEEYFSRLYNIDLHIVVVSAYMPNHASYWPGLESHEDSTVSLNELTNALKKNLVGKKYALDIIDASRRWAGGDDDTTTLHEVSAEKIKARLDYLIKHTKARRLMLIWNSHGDSGWQKQNKETYHFSAASNFINGEQYLIDSKEIWRSVTKNSSVEEFFAIISACGSASFFNERIKGLIPSDRKLSFVGVACAQECEVGYDKGSSIRRSPFIDEITRFLSFSPSIKSGLLNDWLQHPHLHKTCSFEKEGQYSWERKEICSYFSMQTHHFGDPILCASFGLSN